MPQPTQLLSRRQFLLVAAGMLAGCSRSPGRKVKNADQPCPAPAPIAVSHKFIFDRTTVPPADLQQRLVSYVVKTIPAASRLQAVSLGGVTPSLVQEEFNVQLPAAHKSAQQTQAERWARPPEDIRRDAQCLERGWTELPLQRELEELVQRTDNARQARSPIVEAIHAATLGWRGQHLIVWSDGIEHFGQGRTFYGHSGLSLPNPEDWIAQLRQEDLIPDLASTRVTHLAIGLSEGTGSQPRRLRPYTEIAAIKQLWVAYWQASGANALFGEPLPVTAGG